MDSIQITPFKDPPIFRSGIRLMEWRREIGIPRDVFARVADCSIRTLATYEKQPALPDTVRRQVSEAVRLLQALQELVGEDAALKEWLRTANPAFENRTPLELIQKGESDRLWRMVHQVRFGAYA